MYQQREKKAASTSRSSADSSAQQRINQGVDGSTPNAISTLQQMANKSTQSRKAAQLREMAGRGNRATNVVINTKLIQRQWNMRFEEGDKDLEIPIRSAADINRYVGTDIPAPVNNSFFTDNEILVIVNGGLCTVLFNDIPLFNRDKPGMVNFFKQKVEQFNAGRFARLPSGFSNKEYITLDGGSVQETPTNIGLSVEHSILGPNGKKVPGVQSVREYVETASGPYDLGVMASDGEYGDFHRFQPGIDGIQEGEFLAKQLWVDADNAERVIPYSGFYIRRIVRRTGEHRFAIEIIKTPSDIIVSGRGTLAGKGSVVSVRMDVQWTGTRYAAI